MKRLIFIFIVFLLSSFQSFAQTSPDAVPASWLEGDKPTHGEACWKVVRQAYVPSAACGIENKLWWHINLYIR